MPAAENTAVQKKRKDEAASPDRVIFLVVLFVIATVPALTFLFSFGNVGNLGVSLNVDKRIAYLTGPAIDLSVVGLIVAGSYLSHRGWSEKQLWPIHLMSVICGLTMIALNCGQAMYQTKYRLAAFDAVGPLLLIGWGFIGPWLLRQLFAARTASAPRVERQQTVTRPPKTATEPPAKAAPNPVPATPGSGTQTPAVPAAASAVPAPGTGNGGNKAASVVVPINGNGRRSPEAWAELALPLWREYTAGHNGTTPTAPVLADLLRTAHPDLLVPGSERSERNIRSATETLADALDSEPERAEATR